MVKRVYLLCFESRPHFLDIEGFDGIIFWTYSDPCFYLAVTLHCLLPSLRCTADLDVSGKPTCVSCSILRSISQAMSQGHHKDTLKCPKDTGTCSVCWATFRIHRSTGHVHRHGHRDSPCPGSDKPTISASLTQPSADTTKRHTDTLSQTQDEQSPATSGRRSKLSHPSWVTLVNRISQWRLRRHYGQA